MQILIYVAIALIALAVVIAIVGYYSAKLFNLGISYAEKQMNLDAATETVESYRRKWGDSLNFDEESVPTTTLGEFVEKEMVTQ